MKYLWLLLPLTTLWVCTFILSFVLSASPFENWYQIPSLFTAVTLFAVALSFSLSKIVK